MEGCFEQSRSLRGWPLSEKATVVNAENSRFHASFAVFWAVQSLLDNTPPFSPSAPAPFAHPPPFLPARSVAVGVGHTRGDRRRGRRSGRGGPTSLPSLKPREPSCHLLSRTPFL